MSEERLIETPASSDLVTQTIKINDEEIGKQFQILSIQVFKELNRIPSAKIILLDGDSASADFTVSNEDLFIPGSEIDILAGYHSEEELIFKGVIVKHSIKIRQEGSAKLIIECRDKAFRMAANQKSKYFYEVSDSDIIEELITENGLTADVDTTTTNHAEIIQYDVSDWDFMITRAEINGMLCKIENGEISVYPPDFSQEAVIRLEYGSTLIDLDLEMDGRNQFASVKSNAWNQADQSILEVESADPELTENGNLAGSDLASSLELENYNLQFGGSTNEEVLQSWADAKMLRNRLSKIKGRIKFQGIPNILPSNIAELSGVGDRFNGMVFISGVAHSIVNGQWTTDIQVGLDSEWFAKKFPQQNRFSEILPAIKGLQVGIVVQLEEDPDGEDRILVKLPIINPDDEGIWARLSCMDAGDSRGTFFRPEVDDEVIVGFVNEDPLNPVILGMLHSSAKPTPQEITADNNEKGYISRGEMKLLFDDDKVAVTIETPAGKKVVLDEDDGSITIADENENKIILNGDGITIESASDLNLTASGDVNIGGVNITGSADSTFKGEGNGGAELLSSATVKVEGSLVQIN